MTILVKFVRRHARSLGKAALLPAGLAGMYALHALVGRRFGVEEYGQFSLVLAASSLAAVIVTAGMPAAGQMIVARYLASESTAELGRFIAFGLWWTTGSLLCLMSFSALLEWSLPGLLPAGTWHSVPLVTVATALWLWQRYVCLGRGLVTLALVPRELLFVGLMIGYVLATDAPDVQALFLPYTLLLLGSCLPILVAVTRTVTSVELARPERPEIKRWLTTSRSFLLTTTLQLGLNTWDIMLLGVLSSLEETGRYAAATRLAMTVAIVTRVVNTLYGHRFASLHAVGSTASARALFRKIRTVSSVAAVGVFLLVVLLHDEVLRWMGEGYESIGILVLVLASVNLIVVATGPVMQFLNMTGSEGVVARTVGIWSLLSVVANVAAIPALGAVGATLAYVFTNLGMRLHLLGIMRLRNRMNALE